MWALSAIDPEIVKQINDLQSDREKIIMYFEHKAYKGATDSYLYTKEDYQAPYYLKQALTNQGLDWLVLLKKEIHARHGANFSDYKATEIRLPANIKATKAELYNFSLLEGRLLQNLIDRNEGQSIVLDLTGKVYYIKIEKITLNIGHPSDSEREWFYSAFGFDSSSSTWSVEESIGDLLTEKKYNLEVDRNYAVGC